MTPTIDEIKAKQSELAVLIAKFEAQSLRPGEHYAGLVLDRDGNVSHHLVLLPGQAENLTWQAASKWAENAGGTLPTPQEQALLYANLNAKFEPAWYWSSEPYEDDGSYAWGQNFSSGYQYYDRKSYEGRARAVRRVTA